MNDDKRHADYYKKVMFLRMLLPLLGYKAEPLTTLTLVYRHPRGTRIGINPNQMWYNE